jgi:hypothetical protein
MSRATADRSVVIRDMKSTDGMITPSPAAILPISVVTWGRSAWAPTETRV